MRPECTPLDAKAVSISRDLDVVMQQLEARLLCYTDPYDACPPEVWKGAKTANFHGKWPVLRGRTFRDGDDCLQPDAGDVT
ncbi:MAG: hypothetical protein JWM95_826 [Gemmatimonadetes bacterium]|nr:hypothetical protein [Gemmatimonadota bacterium]